VPNLCAPARRSLRSCQIFKPAARGTGLASGASEPAAAGGRDTCMRSWIATGCCLAVVSAAIGIGPMAHAEDDQAPAGGEATAAAAAPAPDPTRGGWDAFLDPLRDFE